MAISNCAISFYRNDLQITKLRQGQCPVKNCKADIKRYKAPFQKYKEQMRYLPFCAEHGLRIHRKSGFVYYNGETPDDLTISIRRNLIFNSDYYVKNFFKKGSKMESGRLCYENSEDAVSYNVFTGLLSDSQALKRLIRLITGKYIDDDVQLYLWGGKIDLKGHTFEKYAPLWEIQERLEKDIKRFKTEPDIMLVVPKKIVICIEAKFGSKNPIAKEKEEREGEKPKKAEKLIERYCKRNNLIDTDEIFNLSIKPRFFYEQLFRNIVFAASMAELENGADWYVVNLRNQHVINLKRGQPESMPIVRNMWSILRPKYKKRFIHLTWEDIYSHVIKGNERLSNLTWYLKNKSLSCGRAFNII